MNSDIKLLVLSRGINQGNAVCNQILGQKLFQARYGQTIGAVVEGRDIIITNLPLIGKTEKVISKEEARDVVRDRKYNAVILVLEFPIRIRPEVQSCINLARDLVGKDILTHNLHVLVTNGSNISNDIDQFQEFLRKEVSGKGEDEFKQLVKDIHSKTLSERKSREWENFTYNHCLLFDHNTDNSTIITQQRQRLINAAVDNNSGEAAIPGSTQQSVNNVLFGSSVVVIALIALLAVGFGLRGFILNKMCESTCRQQLKNEIRNADSTINAKAIESIKIRSELKVVLDNLNETKLELSQITNDYQSKNEALSKIKSDLETEKEILQKLESEITIEKQSLEISSEESKKASQELEEVRSKVGARNAELNKIVDNLERKQGEWLQKAEDIGKANAQLNNLNYNIADNDRRLQGLKHDISNQEELFRKREAEAFDKQELLKKTTDKLTTEYSKLSDVIGQVQRETSEFNRLSDEVSKYNEELSNTQRAIQTEENRLSDIRSDIQNAQEQEQNLVNQIEQVKSELEKQKEKQKAETENIHMLEKKKETLSREVQPLEEKKNELYKILDDLKVKNSDLEKVSYELHVAKNDLNIAKTNKRSTEEDIRKLSKDINELQNKKKDIDSEIASDEKDLLDVNKRLKERKNIESIAKNVQSNSMTCVGKYCCMWL